MMDWFPGILRKRGDDMANKLRDVAGDVLWSYVGAPYVWGGDDPSGWDCSGLVIEWMKSVGLLPRGGDWTADGLLQRFLHCSIDERDIRQMDLVFWTVDGRAVHVETIWDPTDLAVGASGGGRDTLDAEDAAEDNAYVKVRPWASREGRRVFVDPWRA
jgi:hypothetical protein